ncbi:DMT family transporter [Pseudoflavonifractor phocaeensis]|uniref:DMT family transporter n=1 Tax=Pseudoflavonifractor phocaeensis TaxID=1870988 RepID=UPI00313B290A
MGQGILAVVASATILGVMPSMQKQLMVDGLPIFSLMFFTNLIITLVTLAVSLGRGRSLKLSRPQLIQVVLMGLTGMVATAMLINTAYLFMPVGTVTMLHFLYPTVVCIVMGTLFKEGFSKLQVAAIVVSIAGMFFLTGKNGSLPVLGIALAAISSLTYGSYLIANEKGPANDLPLEVKLFYVSLPGTLLFAVLAPATGNLAVPSSPVSWFQLIVCSGLATVGGYFLMMFGIQKLGASTASFLSMLEPVVSVVFGTIWFADPVTVGVVVGSVLILTSVCFITLDSSRKEKRAKEAELTGQTQS